MRTPRVILVLGCLAGACRTQVPGVPPSAEGLAGPGVAGERQERLHLAAADWSRPAPDVLLTRVLTAARPFRELLVSWNVDAPAAGGFHVEARVAAAAGDWSPWLRLGEGGAREPAPCGCGVGWPDGRVAVDLVIAERDLARAQVRVRAHGPAVDGATDPGWRVRRLDLCFSAAEAAEGPPPGAPSGPPRELVGVPRLSQHAAPPALGPRLCSPTSVAMALGALGSPVEPLELAASAYDRRNDLYGNWPRAIQAAWERGVAGYVTRFEGWGDVEAELAAGRPVVLSIRVAAGALRGAPYAETAGHLLLVVGFDAQGDVIVHDPAAPDAESVRRVYEREELGRAWLGHGGTVYVFGVEPAGR